MSLSSFIQKVGEKPAHIRKFYSLSISFFVTAIIFGFWISSFSFINDPEDRVLASVMDTVDTPGKSLVASVGSFANDLKDLVFGPKKVEYSTVEVKPGRK